MAGAGVGGDAEGVVRGVGAGAGSEAKREAARLASEAAARAREAMKGGEWEQLYHPARIGGKFAPKGMGSEESAARTVTRAVGRPRTSPITEAAGGHPAGALAAQQEGQSLLRGRAAAQVAQATRSFNLRYTPFGKGAAGQKSAEKWGAQTAKAHATGRDAGTQHAIDHFLTPNGNDQIQRALSEGHDLTKAEHVTAHIDHETGNVHATKVAVPGKEIHALDHAIDTHTLGRPVYMSRLMGADKFGMAQQDLSLQSLKQWEGRAISESGFGTFHIGALPTAEQQAQHGYTGMRVNMNVMAPADMHAIMPGKMGDGQSSPTTVLTGRDQMYRIYRVTQDPTDPTLLHMWTVPMSSRDLEQKQQLTPHMTDMARHVATGRATPETARALGKALSRQEVASHQAMMARRAQPAPRLPRTTAPGGAARRVVGTGPAKTTPRPAPTAAETRALKATDTQRAEARAQRAATETQGRAEHQARTTAASQAKTAQQAQQATERAGRLETLRQSRTVQAPRGVIHTETTPRTPAAEKQAARQAATEGGTKARFMTPDQRRSVLEKVAKQKALAEQHGHTWPLPPEHAAHEESVRLQGLHEQIHKLPGKTLTEKINSPVGRIPAAPKEAAAAVEHHVPAEEGKRGIHLEPKPGRELRWTERVKTRGGQTIERERSGRITHVHEDGVTIERRPIGGEKPLAERLTHEDIAQRGAVVGKPRPGNAMLAREKGTTPAGREPMKVVRPGQAPQAEKNVKEPTITPAHEAEARKGWHVSEKYTKNGKEYTRTGEVQSVRNGTAKVLWHDSVTPETIRRDDARGWGGGRTGGVVWESNAEHTSLAQQAERAAAREQRRVVGRRLEQTQGAARGERTIIANGRDAAQRIIDAHSRGERPSMGDRIQLRAASRHLADLRQGKAPSQRVSSIEEKLRTLSPGEKTQAEHDDALFRRAEDALAARGKAPEPRAVSAQKPGFLTGRTEIARTEGGDVKASRPELAPYERQSTSMSERVLARRLAAGEITKAEHDRLLQQRLAGQPRTVRVPKATTEAKATTRVIGAPKAAGGAAPVKATPPKATAVKVPGEVTRTVRAPKAPASDVQRQYTRSPSSMLDRLAKVSDGQHLSEEERAAMRAASGGVAKLSPATQRRYFTAIMSGKDPAAGIHEMVHSGVGDHIAPELKALQMQTGGMHKDVYEHSLQVLRNAVQQEQGGKPDLALRLAALFHDIGKPATKAVGAGPTGRQTVTFHNHEGVGAGIIENRLKALGYDQKTVENVRHLVDMHMRLYGGSTQWNDAAIARLGKDAGPHLDQLFKLVRSDVTTKNADRIKQAETRIAQTEQRLKSVTETRAAAGITSGERLTSIWKDKPGGELKPAVQRWLGRLGGKPGDLQHLLPEAYRQLEQHDLITRDTHGMPHITKAGRDLTGTRGKVERLVAERSTGSVVSALRDAQHPADRAEILKGLTHDQLQQVAHEGGMRLPAKTQLDKMTAGRLATHLSKQEVTKGGERGLHQVRTVTTPVKATTRAVRAPRPVSEATQARRSLEGEAQKRGLPTEVKALREHLGKAGFKTGGLSKTTMMQQAIQRHDLMQREAERAGRAEHLPMRAGTVVRAPAKAAKIARVAAPTKVTRPGKQLKETYTAEHEAAAAKKAVDEIVRHGTSVKRFETNVGRDHATSLLHQPWVPQSEKARIQRVLDRLYPAPGKAGPSTPQVLADWNKQAEKEITAAERAWRTGQHVDSHAVSYWDQKGTSQALRDRASALRQQIEDTAKREPNIHGNPEARTAHLIEQATKAKTTMTPQAWQETHGHGLQQLMEHASPEHQAQIKRLLPPSTEPKPIQVTSRPPAEIQRLRAQQDRMSPAEYKAAVKAQWDKITQDELVHGTITSEHADQLRAHLAPEMQRVGYHVKLPVGQKAAEEHAARQAAETNASRAGRPWLPKTKPGEKLSPEQKTAIARAVKLDEKAPPIAAKPGDIHDEGKLLEDAKGRVARGEAPTVVGRDLKERAALHDAVAERLLEGGAHPGGSDVMRARELAGSYHDAASALTRGAAKGKIQTPDITPGDKILVHQTEDGRWVASPKKTGATEIRVVSHEQHGSEKMPRWHITGVTKEGHQIEVSPTRGKAAGVTKSVSFHTPTEARVVAVKAAGTKAPTMTDMKAEARQLGVPLKQYMGLKASVPEHVTQMRQILEDARAGREAEKTAHETKVAEASTRRVIGRAGAAKATAAKAAPAKAVVRAPRAAKATAAKAAPAKAVKVAKAAAPKTPPTDVHGNKFEIVKSVAPRGRTTTSTNWHIVETHPDGTVEKHQGGNPTRAAAQAKLDTLIAHRGTLAADEAKKATKAAAPAKAAKAAPAKAVKATAAKAVRTRAPKVEPLALRAGRAPKTDVRALAAQHGAPETPAMREWLDKVQGHLDSGKSPIEALRAAGSTRPVKGGGNTFASERRAQAVVSQHLLGAKSPQEAIDRVAAHGETRRVISTPVKAAKAVPAKATAPARAVRTPAKATQAAKTVPAKTAAPAHDLTGAKGLSTDPATRATQIENRIREAAVKVGTPPREGLPEHRLSMQQVRAATKDIPRSEVDQALQRLGKQRGISVLPNENQKELTAADRAAAVHIGPQRYDMVLVHPTQTALHPLPSGAKAPATPAKVVRAPAAAAKAAEAAKTVPTRPRLVGTPTKAAGAPRMGPHAAQALRTTAPKTVVRAPSERAVSYQQGGGRHIDLQHIAEDMYRPEDKHGFSKSELESEHFQRTQALLDRGMHPSRPEVSGVKSPLRMVARGYQTGADHAQNPGRKATAQREADKWNELADRLAGMKRPAISAPKAVEAKAPAAPKAEAPHAAQVKDTVRRYAGEGHTVARIAQDQGRSRAAVTKDLKESGVQMRRGGAPRAVRATEQAATTRAVRAPRTAAKATQEPAKALGASKEALATSTAGNGVPLRIMREEDGRHTIQGFIGGRWQHMGASGATLQEAKDKWGGHWREGTGRPGTGAALHALAQDMGKGIPNFEGVKGQRVNPEHGQELFQRLIEPLKNVNPNDSTALRAAAKALRDSYRSHESTAGMRLANNKPGSYHYQRGLAEEGAVHALDRVASHMEHLAGSKGKGAGPLPMRAGRVAAEGAGAARVVRAPALSAERQAVLDHIGPTSIVTTKTAALASRKEDVAALIRSGHIERTAPRSQSLRLTEKGRAALTGSRPAEAPVKAAKAAAPVKTVPTTVRAPRKLTTKDFGHGDRITQNGAHGTVTETPYGKTTRKSVTWEDGRKESLTQALSRGDASWGKGETKPAEVKAPEPKAVTPRVPARATTTGGRRVVVRQQPHEYKPTTEERSAEQKLRDTLPHGGTSEVWDHVEQTMKDEHIPHRDASVPEDIVARLQAGVRNENVLREIHDSRGDSGNLQGRARELEQLSRDGRLDSKDQAQYRQEAQLLQEKAQEALTHEHAAEDQRRDWKAMTPGQQYRAQQVIDSQQELHDAKSHLSNTESWIMDRAQAERWMKQNGIKPGSVEADRIHQIINIGREQRRQLQEQIPHLEDRAAVRLHQWDPVKHDLKTDEQQALHDHLETQDHELAGAKGVDLTRNSTRGEAQPVARVVRVSQPTGRAPAAKATPAAPKAEAPTHVPAAETPRAAALRSSLQRVHMLQTVLHEDMQQEHVPQALHDQVAKAESEVKTALAKVDPNFNDHVHADIRRQAAEALGPKDRPTAARLQAREALAKRITEIQAKPSKAAGMDTPAQRRAVAQVLKNTYHDDPGRFQHLSPEQRQNVKSTLEAIASSGDKMTSSNKDRNKDALHVTQARETLARINEGQDTTPWQRAHPIPLNAEHDSFTSRRARVGEAHPRYGEPPARGTYSDLGTNKHGAPTWDKYLAQSPDERAAIRKDLQSIASSGDRFGRQHRQSEGSAPHVVQAKQLLKLFQEADKTKEAQGAASPHAPSTPAGQLRGAAEQIRQIVQGTGTAEDKRTQITSILRSQAYSGRGHENLQTLDRQIGHLYQDRGRAGSGYHPGTQLDREQIRGKGQKGNIQRMRDSLVPKPTATRVRAPKAATPPGGPLPMRAGRMPGPLDQPTSKTVTGSTKKGLHEIRLPDGTLATRTSATRSYTHALVVTEDRRTRADYVDKRAAQLERFQKDYEEAMRTGDWSKFKKVPNNVRGGFDYAHKEDPGSRFPDYRFPDPNPKNPSNIKNAERNQSFVRTDRSAQENERWAKYGLTPEDVAKYHVDDRAQQTADAVARMRQESAALRTGPETHYFVSQWTTQPTKAHTSFHGQPGYSERAVPVGTDMSGGKDSGLTRPGISFQRYGTEGTVVGRGAKATTPVKAVPAEKPVKATPVKAATKAVKAAPAAKPVEETRRTVRAPRGGPTVADLHKQATAAGIKGHSKWNKDQLQKALAEHAAKGAATETKPTRPEGVLRHDTGGRYYVEQRQGKVEHRLYEDGSRTSLDLTKKPGTNNVTMATGRNPDRAFKLTPEERAAAKPSRVLGKEVGAAKATKAAAPKAAASKAEVPTGRPLSEHELHTIAHVAEVGRRNDNSGWVHYREVNDTGRPHLDTLVKEGYLERHGTGDTAMYRIDPRGWAARQEPGDHLLHGDVLPKPAEAAPSRLTPDQINRGAVIYGYRNPDGTFSPVPKEGPVDQSRVMQVSVQRIDHLDANGNEFKGKLPAGQEGLRRLSPQRRIVGHDENGHLVQSEPHSLGTSWSWHMNPTGEEGGRGHIVEGEFRETPVPKEIAAAKEAAGTTRTVRRGAKAAPAEAAPKERPAKAAPAKATPPAKEPTTPTKAVPAKKAPASPSPTEKPRKVAAPRKSTGPAPRETQPGTGGFPWGEGYKPSKLNPDLYPGASAMGLRAGRAETTAPFKADTVRGITQEFKDRSTAAGAARRLAEHNQLEEAITHVEPLPANASPARLRTVADQLDAKAAEALKTPRGQAYVEANGREWASGRYGAMHYQGAAQLVRDAADRIQARRGGPAVKPELVAPTRSPEAAPRVISRGMIAAKDLQAGDRIMVHALSGKTQEGHSLMPATRQTMEGAFPVTVSRVVQGAGDSHHLEVKTAGGHVLTAPGQAIGARSSTRYMPVSKAYDANVKKHGFLQEEARKGEAAAVAAHNAKLPGERVSAVHFVDEKTGQHTPLDMTHEEYNAIKPEHLRALAQQLGIKVGARDSKDTLFTKVMRHVATVDMQHRELQKLLGREPEKAAPKPKTVRAPRAAKAAAAAAPAEKALTVRDLNHGDIIAMHGPNGTEMGRVRLSTSSSPNGRTTRSVDLLSGGRMPLTLSKPLPEGTRRLSATEVHQTFGPGGSHHIDIRQEAQKLGFEIHHEGFAKALQARLDRGEPKHQVGQTVFEHAAGLLRGQAQKEDLLRLSAHLTGVKPAAPAKAVRVAKATKAAVPKAETPAKAVRVPKAAKAAAPKVETPKTAAPTKAVRVAKAAAPAAPKAPAAGAIDEHVPLKGDPQGDNMRMHGDSPTMQLAQAYAAAGRNGSANAMMDIRRQATSRVPSEGRTPQETVDALKAMRAQEHDPRFQGMLDRAIAANDARPGQLPKMPESTPPLARQLMEELHRIPYARKGPGEESGAGVMHGPSMVDQLAQIYRDAAAGVRGEDGRNPQDRIQALLRSQVHEMNEPAFRIWDLAKRLESSPAAGGARTPTPLAVELRNWERGARAAGEGALPQRAGASPEQAGRVVRRMQQNPFLRPPGLHPDIHVTQTPDGALTGRVDHNHGSVADILTRDTPAEGIPVRDLRLPGHSTATGAHWIRQGTLWRQDGITHIIEHGPGKAEQARVADLRAQLHEAQRQIPAGMEHLQRAYVATHGGHPAEAANAKMKAYAANARGTTYLYHDAEWAQRHGQQYPHFMQDVLSHEAGHAAVDHAGIVDLGTDKPSLAYLRATEQDNPFQVDGFRPLKEHVSQALAAGLTGGFGRTKDLNGKVSKVPQGVTPYGRGLYNEDAAESILLYKKGVIGHDRHGDPVYFRDMFPRRAAEFDKAFPEFADKQKAEVAARGPLTPVTPRTGPGSHMLQTENGANSNELAAVGWLARAGGAVRPDTAGHSPAVRQLLAPDMIQRLIGQGYVERLPSGQIQLTPEWQDRMAEYHQVQLPLVNM